MSDILFIKGKSLVFINLNDINKGYNITLWLDLGLWSNWNFNYLRIEYHQGYLGLHLAANFELFRYC